VLEGPQGTLFGQNATGGAVNYIAAKPTDAFAAGVDATYGRFNLLQIGGVNRRAIRTTDRRPTLTRVRRLFEGSRVSDFI